MDENRLPELPREAFRPMIAQSVQLEQFLGEELTFCFRDLDGAHTFTTCYGDIYKTVNSRPEATHGGCLWNEMNYAPL